MKKFLGIFAFLILFVSVLEVPNVYAADIRSNKEVIIAPTDQQLEDVKEVLHAVDVAQVGMFVKSFLFVPLDEFVDRLLKVIRLRFRLD